MRRLSKPFLILMYLATYAGLVSAQTTGDRDRALGLSGRDQVVADLERAQFRLGPFFLLSRFTLGDLGYTPGIFLPAEEESEGFSLAVSAPQKLYFVPANKLVMSVTAEPTYLWHSKNSDARDWNYSYRGDLHFLFNRLYLDIYGLTANRRQREFSELTYLVTRDEGTLGFQSETALSSRTRFDFDGSIRQLGYEQPETPLAGDVLQLARDEVTLTGGVTHKTFPRTNTSIGFSSTNYDFDQDARDARRDTVYAGAAQRTGRNRFAARIGYTSLSYDGDQFESFDGVVGEASWAFSPRRTLQAQLTATRDVQFSIFERDSHYASNQLSLTGARGADRRVGIQGGLHVMRNSYYVPFVDDDGERKRREDDLFFATLGPTVRVGQRGRFGVSGGYYVRESNVVGLDRDGIQLLLHLSFSE